MRSIYFIWFICEYIYDAAGCDSVHTLNLTINSSDTVILNVTANATYIFNGVIYDTSGIYNWLGTDVNGCDSLVILNLTVLYCDVPSNLSTTNILLDRATLNWDAVSGADHYDVLFSSDGTSWQYILTFIQLAEQNQDYLLEILITGE